MPSTPPLIYAELLPNIRQISVLAALPTPSDATTRVSLSKDRAVLTLVHNGATASLRLPGAISPTYTPTQPHPTLAQLSWRIPLVVSPSQQRAAPSLPAPWSAGALAKTSLFSCRGCGQVILPPGRVTTWRDLPSENWAEMMEFWHCHKPDVPVGEKGEGEGGDNTTKGYGANTRMMAQRGVGKVDLTYFLLDSEDCSSGLEVRIFVILFFAWFLWVLFCRASRRRPASSSLQWQGHRYKCPRAISPLRPRMASVPSHTENGLLYHQASLVLAWENALGGMRNITLTYQYPVLSPQLSPADYPFTTKLTKLTHHRPTPPPSPSLAHPAPPTSASPHPQAINCINGPYRSPPL